jgi:hypothetical protein
MIEGTLIAESIRVGATLDGVRLVTRKIRRAAQGDSSAGQPELWTFIEFEAGEPDAEVLADALARVLDQQHGWYTDFHTPDETFVVYSGRVFRYPRGDGPGRAEAAAYGRSVGVPEDQLDWPALGGPPFPDDVRMPGMHSAMRTACHRRDRPGYSSSIRLSLVRSAATASPSALNSSSVMLRRRRTVNTTSEPLSSAITLIGT